MTSIFGPRWNTPWTRHFRISISPSESIGASVLPQRGQLIVSAIQVGSEAEVETPVGFPVVRSKTGRSDTPTRPADRYFLSLQQPQHSPFGVGVPQHGQHPVSIVILLSGWFYTFHPTGRSSLLCVELGMLIGELAERSGVPARTIRFYEQAEVLTAPQRSANGYRVYLEKTLAELTFIKRGRRLGLSLDEIREILGLGRAGRMPCRRVTAICDAHLHEIGRQMEELAAFRELLEQTRRKASAKCGLTQEDFCKAIMGL